MVDTIISDAARAHFRYFACRGEALFYIFADIYDMSMPLFQAWAIYFAALTFLCHYASLPLNARLIITLIVSASRHDDASHDIIYWHVMPGRRFAASVPLLLPPLTSERLRTRLLVSKAELADGRAGRQRAPIEPPYMPPRHTLPSFRASCAHAQYAARAAFYDLFLLAKSHVDAMRWHEMQERCCFGRRYPPTPILPSFNASRGGGRQYHRPAAAEAAQEAMTKSCARYTTAVLNITPPCHAVY